MILKFKLKESQQVSSLREHFGLGGHQGGQEESSRGRHSAELTLTLPDETALIRQDVKPCSGQPPISQAPGQLGGGVQTASGPPASASPPNHRRKLSEAGLMHLHFFIKLFR